MSRLEIIPREIRDIIYGHLGLKLIVTEFEVHEAKIKGRNVFRLHDGHLSLAELDDMRNIEDDASNEGSGGLGLIALAQTSHFFRAEIMEPLLKEPTLVVDLPDKGDFSYEQICNYELQIPRSFPFNSVKTLVLRSSLESQSSKDTSWCYHKVLQRIADRENIIDRIVIIIPKVQYWIPPFASRIKDTGEWDMRLLTCAILRLPKLERVRIVSENGFHFRKVSSRPIWKNEFAKVVSEEWSEWCHKKLQL